MGETDELREELRALLRQTPPDKLPPEFVVFVRPELDNSKIGYTQVPGKIVFDSTSRVKEPEPEGPQPIPDHGPDEKTLGPPGKPRPPVREPEPFDNGAPATIVDKQQHVVGRYLPMEVEPDEEPPRPGWRWHPLLGARDRREGDPPPEDLRKPPGAPVSMPTHAPKSPPAGFRRIGPAPYRVHPSNLSPDLQDYADSLEKQLRIARLKRELGIGGHPVFGPPGAPGDHPEFGGPPLRLVEPDDGAPTYAAEEPA